MKEIIIKSLRDAAIFTLVWFVGRSFKMYHLLTQAKSQKDLGLEILLIAGLYLIFFIIIFLIFLCYRSLKRRRNLNK